jgi:predicted RNA-binding Zn-ribbon protein involved in translation (DUF1610 family)
MSDGLTPIDRIITARVREQKEWQEAKQAVEAWFGQSYDRKFPVKAEAERPECPNCGKQLVNRNLRYESQTFVIGQKVLPYQENHLLLVCESLVVGPGMGPNNGPGARLSRTIWDGTSYLGSGNATPFCTARCAIAFAQLAYNNGFRGGDTQNTVGQYLVYRCLRGIE